MVTEQSAPRPLDEQSTAAIRRALSEAQQGRLSAALETGEQALAAGGDTVALNAMLGMLRVQSGDPAGAIANLQVAHAARPNDPRVAGNLATALLDTGEAGRALDVLPASLAFADPTLRLARYRGFIAQTAQDHAAAVDAYEHVLKSAPNDWEAWNNLGNSRLGVGDVEGAVAALRRATELNPGAAPTRLNLARALGRAGDLEAAERELRSMAEAFAEDEKPLMDLHELLIRLGRPEEEVLATLEQARARNPDDVAITLAIARRRLLALDMEEAEREYRHVLKDASANAEAYVGLAVVYEHSRPSALADLAAEARNATAGPAVDWIEAMSLRRQKRYAEALAAVIKVPESFETARRAQLLGQIRENLRQFDEAFEAFTRMNEAQAADPSQPVARAAKLRTRMRGDLDRTTQGWVDSWAAGKVEPERSSPVFLVGFPRSGTTLLDTMLMGHPDAEVMEERPILNRIEKEIGGFDAIARLTADQVRHAQQRYFEIAAEYTELRDGALLIDKSPLLLRRVPLIHRLFPESRFILALRHPADAVLSCFVSNFRLNSGMSNFLQLDTAAEFYDLCFQTWERGRSLLPIKVHTVVYEQLIADTEHQLRTVADAIGLGWRDEMLDHRKTAANRGLVATASYAQVTEPIYSSSVDRWRNYRAHLEPILPTLEPWVRKFGYGL